MKVAIIGGGAIGLLTGFYFRSLGHTVTIVTRTKNQRDLLLDKGITLEEGTNKTRQQVMSSCFQETTYKNNDLWIIALKQSMLDTFFDRWKDVPRLPEMVFLQNGMGHLEKAEMVFRNPINAGVVTHGAIKKSHTVVLHRGKGEIIVGSWSGNSTVIYELQSTMPLFPISLTNDISYVLKQKLLVNLIVNPLTALYRVKNGVLLSNEHWLEVVRGIFQEGIEVLQLSEKEWEMTLNVIEQTANNESSMYRDLRFGRRTEIDTITGYALELAKKQGMNTPLIKFMHHSILGLERGGNLNG